MDGSGGTTVYKHVQMVVFIVSDQGRTHVVAVAYVRSEREDVFKAIFSLLKVFAPGWSLRAVQSDLAAAAYNAAASLQAESRLWGAFEAV